MSTTLDLLQSMLTMIPASPRDELPRDARPRVSHPSPRPTLRQDDRPPMTLVADTNPTRKQQYRRRRLSTAMSNTKASADALREQEQERKRSGHHGEALPYPFYEMNEPSPHQHTLYFDTEAASVTDISLGVTAYTSSAHFGLLLIAYAIDDAPVQMVDLLHGEEMSAELVSAFTSPDYRKVAHNILFDAMVLFKATGIRIPLCQMHDTAGLAASIGLPRSLRGLCQWFNLPDEMSKMQGADGIRLFSTGGFSAAKTNSLFHPDAWRAFRTYCQRDVESLRVISHHLPQDFGDAERRAWQISAVINTNGIPLDMRTIIQAERLVDAEVQRLANDTATITGINIASPTQMLAYMREQGVGVADTREETLRLLLQDERTPASVRKMIDLRLQQNSAPAKKLPTMIDASVGGRIYDSMKYFGAHTGRWSGQGAQPHNLPRGSADDELLSAISAGDNARLRQHPNGLLGAIASQVRPMISAPSGKTFVVSDWSAIEARLSAWVAGVEWALAEFRGAGRIYEMTAAKMFGLDVDSITKHSPERAKGKVAVLALGYGGGPSVLRKMDSTKAFASMSDDDLRSDILEPWRKANQPVVDYWDALLRAFLSPPHADAIEMSHGISIRRDGATTLMRLPSGRVIHYHDVAHRGGQLSYKDYTAGGRCISIHGGLLYNNLVQAIARDLMAEALQRITTAGYRIAFHVHDEVVVEVAEMTAEHDSDNIRRLMCMTPAWADGLPLSASADISARYLK